MSSPNCARRVVRSRRSTPSSRHSKVSSNANRTWSTRRSTTRSPRRASPTGSSSTDLGVATYQSPSECTGQDAEQSKALTLDDLYDEIDDVATLFDVKDKGVELTESLKDRAATATAALGAENVTLAWWYAATKTPYFAGCCGAPGIMTDAVGAKNAFDDNKQYWPEIGWESVLDRDPTVAGARRSRPRWRRRQCRRQDRVPRIGPGRQQAHRSEEQALHHPRGNDDGSLDPQCRWHRTALRPGCASWVWSRCPRRSVNWCVGGTTSRRHTSPTARSRFDVILDVSRIAVRAHPVHGRRSGLRAGFTERPDSREVRACERCGDRLRPDAAGARPPVVDAFR